MANSRVLNVFAPLCDFGQVTPPSWASVSSESHEDMALRRFLLALESHSETFPTCLFPPEMWAPGVWAQTLPWAWGREGRQEGLSRLEVAMTPLPRHWRWPTRKLSTARVTDDILHTRALEPGPCPEAAPALASKQGECRQLSSLGEGLSHHTQAHTSSPPLAFVPFSYLGTPCISPSTFSNHTHRGRRWPLQEPLPCVDCCG